CKTLFLNGLKDMMLFMCQVEGFVNPLHPDWVLKLNRSLYGLKQASRIWYLLLRSEILRLGFQETTPHVNIFFPLTKRIYIVVYVDDIIIAGPSKQICEEIYLLLNQQSELAGDLPCDRLAGRTAGR